MTPRPRIGISGIVKPVAGADRTGVNAAYVHSVVQAGGLPLVLSPIAGEAAARDAIHAVDALLLTGGDDVDPARYAAAPHPALGEVDPARDAFELALYAEARAAGRPVLAICRGLQLVNVACGGTLIQDLPSERPGPIAHGGRGARDARVHAVRLGEDTRTARALGVPALHTNSFHHQAVDRLGSGLVVTGWSEDDGVEALQTTDGAWMVAVQWHPEEFWREPESPDQRLFTAFVRAAAEQLG